MEKFIHNVSLLVFLNETPGKNERFLLHGHCRCRYLLVCNRAKSNQQNVIYLPDKFNYSHYY